MLAFAHVGGRYADLHAGHDVAIERSVEVHSSWGTFEWLLFDAFELGHRVGVVCNSDDHKGRPGASHPGASIFGAYGGLTCLHLDELTRAAIWECMQARRHYGTTGDRLHLAVDATFAAPALRYAVDPKLDPAATGTPVRTATWATSSPSPAAPPRSRFASTRRRRSSASIFASARRRSRRSGRMRQATSVGAFASSGRARSIAAAAA